VTGFVTGVTLTSTAAADTITLQEGVDATATKTIPVLVASGPAMIRVGLWKNEAITIDTTRTDGNDSITVASAANAHQNNNLSIQTGTGADTVTFGGAAVFAEAIDLDSTTIQFGASSSTTAGTSLTIDGSSFSTGVGAQTTAKTIDIDAATVVLGTNATTSAATSLDIVTKSVSLGAGAQTSAGTTLTILTTDATFDSGSVTTAAGNLTVTHTGKATLTNATLTSSTGAVALPGAGRVLVNGTNSIGAQSTITIAGPVDGPGSLALTAGEKVTLQSSVGGATALMNLRVTAPAIELNGAKVVTTNNQFYAGPVVAGQSILFQTSTNGNIIFDKTLNPLAVGQDLTFTAPGAFFRVSEATGNATPWNIVTITDAQDATFGRDLFATRLVQTSGTGTTTLAATTITGTGDAVSLKTNGVAINGPMTALAGDVKILAVDRISLLSSVSVPAGGVTLALGSANATATQLPSAAITTKVLSLSGFGNFDLQSPTNSTSSSAGNLFINLTSGTVKYRESGDLTLLFDDATGATPAIRTVDGDVTLTNSGNFTAKVSQLQTSTPLVSLGSGTLSVFPGGGGASQIVFIAEANAKAINLGTPIGSGEDGTINNKADQFTVRPSVTTPINVFGNAPNRATDQLPPGDRFSLSTLNLNNTPTSLVRSGDDGTYSFSGAFQPITFKSIEEIGGRSLEAFIVLLPNGADGQPQFNIRAVGTNSSSDGDNLRETVTINGSRIPTNPFVVTPERRDPSMAFGSPEITIADVNGDNTPDFIVAAGVGQAPLVTIIDGNSVLNGNTIDISTLKPSQILAQFYAFEPTFFGGVNVAAGNLNGTAGAELVIGANAGGGQRVVAFQYNKGTSPDPFNAMTPFNIPNKGSSFFVFDENPNFRGGVNIALGDVNGDGQLDLICGAGVGGGPRVDV
ncbi:MAG: beta strand repeat-containing protein, partial [Gemmataceae bacterium]